MSAMSYAAAKVISVLPRETISRVAGRAADWHWPSPLGRAVVSAYCKAYDIDLSEYPERTWPSFDAFFTRRLADGRRPIEGSPGSLVSPADGQVHGGADVEAGTYRVKGTDYTTSELVGCPVLSAALQQGSGVVIYLSPRDYHRVHSPVDGTLSAIRSIPGEYFPVNDLGMKHVPRLFARNRRVVFELTDTPFGRVAVVMVAAIVVGRITTPFVAARDIPAGRVDMSPGATLRRGDDLGTFHLGSTVVIVTEKRVEFGPSEGRLAVGRELGRPALEQA